MNPQKSLARATLRIHYVFRGQRNVRRVIRTLRKHVAVTSEGGLAGEFHVDPTGRQISLGERVGRDFSHQPSRQLGMVSHQLPLVGRTAKLFPIAHFERPFFFLGGGLFDTLVVHWAYLCTFPEAFFSIGPAEYVTGLFNILSIQTG
jgi:hypothetical protein